MRMNKRGGMELSMSTIVIIVIAIIVLIFGIIFGRNIMCSGIRATDQIDTAVKNQLRDIFGSDRIGVSCQGEEGSKVKLATGERVSLVCQIKTESPTEYTISIEDPVLLPGGEKEVPMKKSWILKSGWKGNVNPGNIMYAPVLYLNIPRDASKSTVSVKINVRTENGQPEPHYVVFDLQPLNFIQTTMC